MLSKVPIFNASLDILPSTKLLISTINAHSYNIYLEDIDFRHAINSSNIVLPDGISIVLGMKLLGGKKLKKIAGNDLFDYEMQYLQYIKGKGFFLGSSNEVLEKIYRRASFEFPSVTLATYSPPYKDIFSKEDNNQIINAINDFHPDVLFIGMTAPKQEKWAFDHFNELQVGHVCCIGAVFDFYAGTVKRAPQWMINSGLEWLFRLIKEPRRMWRRYLIGNLKFIFAIFKEKYRL
ncbi:WecB/TagA/CpsF family glycosyltransferase [Paludibacter sp.]|uniref:WecB/TagA/CpsF family glycosyltransferase n=1 Tax=Paludibacter sp. TaxID=1898105 RepID=UPI001354E5BF|nr:WecB/TagA/CpsF family glycosyltransferase [Paludibacter sp.]MTK52796.1 WecB/TagA/CpsF family glycosyltransferase [Paludibacter sp.]